MSPIPHWINIIPIALLCNFCNIFMRACVHDMYTWHQYVVEFYCIYKRLVFCLTYFNFFLFILYKKFILLVNSFLLFLRFVCVFWIYYQRRWYYNRLSERLTLEKVDLADKLAAFRCVFGKLKNFTKMPLCYYELSWGFDANNNVRSFRKRRGSAHISS